jgi:hypothetical protein
MSRASSKSIITMAVLAGASLMFAGRLSAQVALDDEFAKDPTWKAPSASDVRTSIVAWLDVRKPEEAIRKQAEALWPAPAGESVAQASANNIDSAELLERVVTTMSLADPDAKQLVDLCSKPHSTSPTPTFTWLTDKKTPAVVRNNLRLWLGKWLAQERLYDEAMAQLADLQPADVVDPASLLFYQSVCHHWMLHKTDGLKTIARLLEQKKTIPRRYEQLAELMQNDLSELEDDSLDHISRRMNDVTRRLDFGHAGKKVRGVEDGIVASLDKLIKEMEDMANASQRNRQQRQQQQGGQDGDEDRDGQGRRRNQGADPDGIRSRSPATESRVAKGRGAGEVKSKNIGNHSGWGDLPPKEKEEAIQQISKEFPSHYRDIIEQYFRKLASEEEEK